MAKTNNPDLSALAAYPGRYSKELFSRFYNGMDFMNDLTVYPNVKSKMQLTKLSVNDEPRPYTGKFEPQDGDLVYAPRELVVDLFQRDIEVDPKKYQPTFLAEMTGAGSGSDNLNIPFAAFMWETVMGEQGASLNDKTAFFGKGKAAYSLWASGSTYSTGNRVYFNDGNRVNYYVAIASTSTGQSPLTHPAKWKKENAMAITKGLGTIIADEIAGGGLTAETIGSVTSSNGYDAFMAIWRKLPAAVRAKGATIFCSYTDYDAMVDQYESAVGKYTISDNGVQFLPKTDRKCVVKPATWMNGSRRLICTPKANLVVGVDRAEDANTITTIPQHYTIEASISGVIGFQIRDLSAIVVGDQA